MTDTSAELMNLTTPVEGRSVVSLRALNWRSGYPSRLIMAGGAGRLLGELLQTASDEHIVLDTRGILGYPDDAFRSLRNLVSDRGGGFSVIGRGLDKTFFEDSLGPANWRSDAVTTVEIGHWGPDQPVDDLSVFLSGYQESRRSTISDWVGECFQPGWRRLHSTPVRASGLFEARHLIGEPLRYITVCDELANTLERIVEELKLGYDREFGVLAVSLRGSALAAGVALMTGYHKTLHVVDHMGPKYRVIEDHSLLGEDFTGEYVLVSDFVVGGTELRAAVAYAHQRSAIIRNALSIGRLLGPDGYGDDVHVHALLDLNDTIPDLQFEFP